MGPLDDDEKGVDSIDTPGGAQEMSIISEAGLYSLILRSRKPEAKAFKRWVTHDIREVMAKCTESFTAPNFGFSEYTDSTSRSLDGVESDIDN